MTKFDDVFYVIDGFRFSFFFFLYNISIVGDDIIGKRGKTFFRYLNAIIIFHACFPIYNRDSFLFYKVVESQVIDRLR